MRRIHFALGTWALVLAAGPHSATAQQPMPGMSMDSASMRTSQAAVEAMSMSMPMGGDPHMRMTAPRPPAPGDSARAAALVVTLRAALAKYRDVKAAEADGYQIFLPDVPQQVYHYTNRRNGLVAAFGFDPARPTSLLYRKTSGGGWELRGAMYTARANLTEDQLNERVPLSVAHWHQHVNWCLPPAGAQSRWLETRNGKPLFGPRSEVATREACEQADGRFVPRIFGWMVHADVFASDDPRVIWGDEDHAHP